MTIDWTKYPELPKSPVVPEWRDTPEREAFLRDYMSLPFFCNRKIGCLFLLALDLLLTVVTIGLFLSNAELDFNILDMSFFLAIAFMILIPAMLLWFIIERLFKIRQILRLARKHGFLMLHLKRPNVKREIMSILNERPHFDQQSFRALWPSTRHAQCAERLLAIASEYWHRPAKMLYPNDPLLFFFFGKSFPCWWNRMVEPDGDFWMDLVEEFNATEELARLDKDSTIAELVECLLGNN